MIYVIIMKKVGKILKNKEIVKIISKSFDRELSDEERVKLKAWLDLSEGNRAKYKTYQKLWKQAESLAVDDAIDVEAALIKTKNKIGSFKKGRRDTYPFLKIAASIVVLVSVASSAWFLGYRSSGSQSSGTVYQEVKAMHGTNTQLQLADGTNVWLNSGSTLAFSGVFSEHRRTKRSVDGGGLFRC